MFSKPRTWVDGESEIRNESFNMGLAENLEAFRSIFLKRNAISVISSEEIEVPRTTPENAKSTWVYVGFSGTIHRGFSWRASPLYEYYGADSASVRRPNIMEKPAVLWVPFGNINAAKKSSENVYIKSTVSFFYSKAFEDQYQVSDSVLSYEYLGSTTDQGPITSAEKTVAWSPQLSSTSSYRVKLATEEVLLDTSDMSTTDVSAAAFRFRLKQFGMRQIEEGYGSDKFDDFSIEVELVIK